MRFLCAAVFLGAPLFAQPAGQTPTVDDMSQLPVISRIEPRMLFRWPSLIEVVPETPIGHNRNCSIPLTSVSRPLVDTGMTREVPSARLDIFSMRQAPLPAPPCEERK